MKLCDPLLAKCMKNGQSAYLVARHTINYQQDYSDQYVFTEISQEKKWWNSLPTVTAAYQQTSPQRADARSPPVRPLPSGAVLTSVRPASTAARTSSLSVHCVSISWPEEQAAHPHCPSAYGMKPSSHLLEIPFMKLLIELTCKAPALTPDCFTEWEA